MCSFKIILMIWYGRPKLNSLLKLRYDIKTLLLKHFYKPFRCLFLLRVYIKNDRAILLSDVRALPVNLGRVVNFEEQPGKSSETDFCRVIFDLNRFNVSGLSAADLFVSRLFYGSTHIS